MSIQEQTIQDVLSACDIVDVIESHVRLTKSGRNFKARCPFHNEKTPSFVVNSEKQIFHCFGCGAGGNAIGFIMKMEGLTYPEAIRKLAAKYNITIKETYSNIDDKLSKERETIYKVLDDASLFFQKHLLERPEIKDYLGKRGLTDETIKKFRIGYAPNGNDSGLSQFLLTTTSKKGYSEEILYKSGLASSNRDFFIDRVMFPIFDVTGRVVAFGGRVVSDTAQPKYINSPETAVYSKSKILYGLNFAGKSMRENNSAIILEGYMDVIMCHQYGITNTVATLGTAFTSFHCSLLKRYTDNITLAYDPDTAGKSAAIRSCEILLNDDLYVKIAHLPDGCDSDEVLIKNGTEKLREIFSNSKSYIDFFIDEKSSGATGFDVKTADGKRNITKLLVPIISKVPNSVVKHEYTKILSERLGMREELIKAELSRFKGDAKRYNSAPDLKVLPPTDETNAQERNFVSVLAYNLKLMDDVPDNLLFNFSSTELKKIFDALRNLRISGKESVKPSELIELVNSDITSKILLNEFKPSEPKKFIKSFVDASLLRAEKKKLDEIKNIDIIEFMRISRKNKGSKK